MKTLNDTIKNLTDKLTGTTKSENPFSNSNCSSCHKTATTFRDSNAEREFRQTGLCQDCQDSTYGL